MPSLVHRPPPLSPLAALLAQAPAASPPPGPCQVAEGPVPGAGEGWVVRPLPGGGYGVFAGGEGAREAGRPRVVLEDPAAALVAAVALSLRRDAGEDPPFPPPVTGASLITDGTATWSRPAATARELAHGGEILGRLLASREAVALLVGAASGEVEELLQALARPAARPAG